MSKPLKELPVFKTEAEETAFGKVMIQQTI
jgi:hypothetical protein